MRRSNLFLCSYRPEPVKYVCVVRCGPPDRVRPGAGGGKAPDLRENRPDGRQGDLCGRLARIVQNRSDGRLPRGRCTGETGRETTEGGATAVISTPSDNVENRPGTPRCAGLVLGTRIGMYTPHLFKGPLSSILFDGRAEVNHAREQPGGTGPMAGPSEPRAGGNIHKGSRPVTGRYSPGDRAFPMKAPAL